MRLPLRRLAAPLAAALALAGCAGSPAPRESYYTLAAPPVPAEVAGQSPSVFVGPIAVPDAVDRTPMVLRSGAHQVELSELHRWAEPLKGGIARVLAQSLMRELGTRRVMASRSAAAAEVDFRVAVEIQRFDSSLEEGAAIDALWTVTPRQGAPRTGRTLAQEAAPSRDPAGVAAAHSRALQRVAAEIAAAIRK